MGFAHNTMWQNVLWPDIINVERGRIPAFFILPGPIKVNKNHRVIGLDIENVGIPQVPKDNIFFVKEMHCLFSPLGDDFRNWSFVLSELPNGLPRYTVHNNHV